jgi:hypothetical protein
VNLPARAAPEYSGAARARNPAPAFPVPFARSPREQEARLASYPTTGPLFTDEAGEPLPYWRWNKLWAAAMRTANTKIAEQNQERIRVAGDKAELTGSIGFAPH